MSYYVNMRTIEAVHRALNIQLPRGLNQDKVNGVGGSPEEEEGEEVEEDVIDDMYNDD